MADTYAWSDISYGVERDEVDPTVIVKRLQKNRGEKVSQSDLKVSDSEWDSLLESGAVRDYPLPDELNDPLRSPNQLIAEGLAESETVAATYGVSPELVDAYSKQQKKLQAPTKAEVQKA